MPKTSPPEGGLDSRSEGRRACGDAAEAKEASVVWGVAGRRAWLRRGFDSVAGSAIDGSVRTGGPLKYLRERSLLV